MTESKLPKCTTVLALLMMVFPLPACKGLRKNTINGEDGPEMPGARTNFLPAKVVAFRHAMANMPDEEKRYGDEYYAASGIVDPDPSHVFVLKKALADMDPPVISADEIYTRGQNSKWMQGRPVMVWTSQVERVTEDVHVFLVVGWMHSNLLYQFFEYEVRWIKKNDSWELVDWKPIQQATQQ